MEVGCNGYNCVLDPHMDLMETRFKRSDYLSGRAVDAL